MFADRKRTDREFVVGNWVLVKLQPYRKSTLRDGRYHKLVPKYYGTFEIIQKIWQVAYKLQLPSTAQIHPIFHVSQLKSFKSSSTPVMGSLPHLNGDGLISQRPVKILERKLMKVHNRPAVYVLIQWQGGTSEDATWESIEDVMLHYPDFGVFDQQS
ncbi:uncharacterized protein [Rutidosis leptorrhynchoides]|uniref:uncharacterized protein n=1 Tax=Rutidosis leptorrhynchoides TaxID=125765 RepID=UPI003A994215